MNTEPCSLLIAHWHKQRTTRHRRGSETFFTLTHPFHPLRGRRFELVKLDRRWWRWRVFYFDEEGTFGVFPANWTDLRPPDPFLEKSQGRAIAGINDLLQLAEVIQKIQRQGVNENMPVV